MTVKMKGQHRIDHCRLDSIEVTQQGFIKANCNATKYGIFHYAQPDGKVIRELRPRSEVFDEASVKTLSHVPITDEHPPEMITPSNVKDFQHGLTSQDPVVEDPFLKCGVLIQTDSLIAKVKANNGSEVSCGYTCDIEKTAGIHEGHEYDQIQRNIVYNHLAVTRKGRAGSEVRIRLDAAEQIIHDKDSEGKPKNRSQGMANVKIGNIEFKDLTDGAATAIDAHIRKDAMTIEELSKTVTDLKTQLASKAQELEAVVKQIEELKGAGGENQTPPATPPAPPASTDSGSGEQKDDMGTNTEENKDMETKENLDSVVKERVNLLRKAEKVDSETNFEPMSNAEVMLHCVNKVKPEMKLDSKVDEKVLSGVFMTLNFENSDRNDSFDNAASEAANKKTAKPDEARNDSMKSAMQRWQKPLNAK